MTTDDNDTKVHYLRPVDDKDKMPPVPAFVDELLQPLPSRAIGYTLTMIFNGMKIVMRTANYADGKVAEVMVDMPGMNTAARSVLSSFTRAISVGLQRGIPLEVYVRTFLNTRSGMNIAVTGNDRIFWAASVEDLIIRELAISYLGRNDLIQEPLLE